MALTIAGIESELVARLRGKLVNPYWTLSVLTSGSNPDLRGPIRYAVRALGGEPADALAVVDADVAGFTGWDVEKLLDLATIQTLKACLGQIAFVDVQVDSDMQRLSQLNGQIMAEIAYYEQRLNEGPNRGAAVVGKMTGSTIPHDPFPRHRHCKPGHWPLS